MLFQIKVDAKNTNHSNSEKINISFNQFPFKNLFLREQLAYNLILDDFEFASKFSNSKTTQLCISLFHLVWKISSNLRMYHPEKFQSLYPWNRFIDVIGTKFDNIVQHYILVI